MSNSSTVLIIEEDSQKRQIYKSVLEFVEQEGRITDCRHWKETLTQSNTISAILLGDCGADETLLKVFQGVKEVNSTLPIIRLVDKVNKTTKNQSDIEAQIQSKAFMKLDLPLKYTQLTQVLHQATVFSFSKKKSNESRSAELFRSLVGNSRSVRNVREMMGQVADSEATVLILGESGTGKEVVARNLHYNSNRRNKPFVPVNCGAIPTDLLESELFGHEKGAFTGAISARQGRFELAEGGTLFLDEIGDMSLHMQVKMLRVLQERTYERVGSNKSVKADVRIVAATHRNLEVLIRDGKFREDLFYRLNVFPIEMPPLYERLDDIPLLINELITRMESEKRGSVRLTPAAVMSLCQYRWPGNVRELANLIERLVIMYPYGVVDFSDLPEKFRYKGRVHIADEIAEEKAVVVEGLAVGQMFFDEQNTDSARLPSEGIDLKEHLSNLEFNLIKQALDDAGGVVAHAAKRLKMRRTTLVEKLRKYGLQRQPETSTV